MQKLKTILALFALFISLTIPATALVGAFCQTERISDFPQYYAAAKLIVLGKGNYVYDLPHLFTQEKESFPKMKEIDRQIAFYLPPFALPLLAILAFLSPSNSYIAWLLLNSISVLISIYVLTKFFRLSLNESFWLATLIFTSGPLFETLKIGQPAPLLLLGFSCALPLIYRNHQIFAGVSLSTLLLKPQEFAPICLYFIFSKQKKVFYTILAIVCLLSLISLFLIGIDGWYKYFVLIVESNKNSIYMQPELCATIRGQLLRIQYFSIFSKLSINIASIFSLLFAYLIICYTGCLTSSKNLFSYKKYLFAGLLSISLPLGLVSSLHCHDYDLLLLCPFFIYLFLSPRIYPETVNLNSQSKGLRMHALDLLEKLNQIVASLLLLAFFISFYLPIHYQLLIQQHNLVNPIFVLLFLTAITNCLKFFVNSHTKISSLNY